MKRIFHTFLYYSSAQRKGMIALIILFWGIVAGENIYRYYHNQQPLSKEELDSQKVSAEALKEFMSTLNTKAHPLRTHTAQKMRSNQTNLIPANLFPFNPNRADSATFVQLGLPRWMARNILRYRQKGGIFKKATDFKKVYGLSTEQYKMLIPYIIIAPQDTLKKTTRTLLLIAQRDSSLHLPSEKYTPGTVIELNQADTAQLKKIPGIGSGIARMMVRYRQELGGYYTLEQLKEIHLDHHQLQSWLQVDTNKISRIAVNQASVKRLMRHPYINFYQAKALVEYRKHRGPLKNLKPFRLMEEFTPNDLERISRYLSFDLPKNDLNLIP